MQLKPNFANLFSSSFATWSRIEPRSRSNDFSRGLQNRFGGPLWNIARQKQVGEFKAEDSGSPIKVAITYRNKKLTHVKPGPEGEILELSGAPPLEAIVERQSVPLDWRTRVQIGQQFERYLKTELGLSGAAETIRLFRSKYSLELPTAHRMLAIDRTTQRFIKIVAGKTVDGEKLFENINFKFGQPEIIPEVPSDINGDRESIQAALHKLKVWWESMYTQPADPKETAWIPERLEHQFDVMARSGDHEVTLRSTDYRNGEFDWYSVSAAEGPSDLSLFAESKTNVYLPNRVSFHGKPLSRWFAMEDEDISIGELDVATTDIGKLMLMHFGLVYSDDWFMVPLELPLGSATQIEKICVTDVFGITTEIHRAATPADSPLDRWESFGLSPIQNPSGAATSDLFFLPSVIGKRDESAPIEEVIFSKDEASNLVWAIQNKVTNGLGNPIDGLTWYSEQMALLKDRELRPKPDEIKDLIEELNRINAEIVAALVEGAGAVEALRAQAQEILNRLTELLKAISVPHETEESLGETQSESSTGKIPEYKLVSDVKPHWIPFLPARISLNAPSIIFHKAEALSAENDPSIENISRILGPATDNLSIHRLNEETITRTGAKVQITRQRVRSADGQTYVWLSRKILTGRGEGSGVLRFDNLAGA